MPKVYRTYIKDLLREASYITGRDVTLGELAAAINKSRQTVSHYANSPLRRLDWEIVRNTQRFFGVLLDRSEIVVVYEVEDDAETERRAPAVSNMTTPAPALY